MIAQLSQLSESAQPTAFHRFLHSLDQRRRLLRVYTQNIDALEEKSGLTFGIPELDGKRYKPRSTKGKALAVDAPDSAARAPDAPSTSRLPSPPAETPKCIPLHGTLQSVHCLTCTHSYPLRDYLGYLASGTPPPCPQCTESEEFRQQVGKRSRGVGRLRPSVVLYNEDHKDGEEVGNVVRKDLMGSSKGKGRAGADLLLVVGTSLRVPGTKRIVREFSKAVRSRHAAMSAPADEPTTSAHGLVTPTPSPRRSPAGDEEPPVRTIYLNLDFPVPTREWEGVFDVWIRGDAQEFARMVHEELEREEQAKEATKERRRKREEAAAEVAKRAEEQEPRQMTGGDKHAESGQEKRTKKRKDVPSSENGEKSRSQPVKKRKTGVPLLSPPSPPSKLGKEKKNQKGKAKAKAKAKARQRGDAVLPTPPSSRDDTSRKLVIKVPARRKTSPKMPHRVSEPAQPSSPLSSPPPSTCPTPPTLSRTYSATTQSSSSLTSPPASVCADSPYDLSRMSSTLSQISSPSSSPSPSTHLPTPPKQARSLSTVTQLSPLTALSSSSQSPYDGDVSPPPSPSPSPSKRRRTSNDLGCGSANRPWLMTPPGMRQPQFVHRHSVEEEQDNSEGADEGEYAPRTENRWPESYVRTVSFPDRRRAR